MTTAFERSGNNHEGLAKLNGWARDGDVLVKSFKFDSYLAGVAFASTVGVIAEGMNHHPDLSIGWRRVDVSFTTHDAGNKLSAKDFRCGRSHRRGGLPGIEELSSPLGMLLTKRSVNSSCVISPIMWSRSSRYPRASSMRSISSASNFG